MARMIWVCQRCREIYGTQWKSEHDERARWMWSQPDLRWMHWHDGEYVLAVEIEDLRPMAENIKQMLGR